MTVQTLAAWLLGAMVTWSPPAVHREGAEEARARYESIADDIAFVSLDPDEPPVFEGTSGRAKTALLVAAIASYESGYRKDVDTGQVRGDHGKSWCIMQIQVRGKTAEGWTGEDLVEERKRCVRAALHRIRASFVMCRKLPLLDRLSGYTLGRCRKEPKAEWRTLRAMKWWQAHPLPGEHES